MKILLIIPAHNEEDSLKATVDSVFDRGVGIDFLIVNDGSKDGTVQICRENEYPFLDLPVNLGLAGAFQAGMKYAYRHDYDCAIQFDADGQHLPEYIAPLIEAIEENDIAIGSRFLDQKKPRSMRMVGSNLISAAIKLTTGKKLTDPTSGMRAFNKRMIKQLALGLNFGPEPDTVSYLIKRADAKVTEVPVRMADRFAGESYLNVWTSATYMLRMTVSILFIQLFRKRIR
ncbi:MAG: glycosyltransferase family 2 protein [Eggerthellaceae bacterium]